MSMMRSPDAVRKRATFVRVEGIISAIWPRPLLRTAYVPGLDMVTECYLVKPARAPYERDEVYALIIPGKVSKAEADVRDYVRTEGIFLKLYRYVSERNRKVTAPVIIVKRLKKVHFPVSSTTAKLLEIIIGVLAGVFVLSLFIGLAVSHRRQLEQRRRMRELRRGRLEKETAGTQRSSEESTPTAAEEQKQEQ
jgi:hypothetical protein